MAEAEGAHKAPPDGFELTASRGKFTLHNGPTYRASEDGDSRSGLWVLDRHCNGMGFLHGGMAAAFADSSMAWALWAETGRMGVTAKLTISYMDIVREGSWLEAHPAVQAVNAELVHVSARLLVGERVTGRADAVFRMLRQRKD